MKQLKKWPNAIFENILLRRNLYLIGDKRLFSIRLNQRLRSASAYWPLALGKFIPGTVFDIGANKGQVSDELKELYRPNFFALVEPIPCLADLLRKKQYASKQKIFECALGANAGVSDFNVIASSPSSSLLQIAPNLEEVFDKPMNVEEKTKVNIRMLDEIFNECNVPTIDLLKIDVQGYELEVLKGGETALQNTQVIVCEVLFFHHYEKQAMFEDIYAFLIERGFLMLTTLGWLKNKEGRPLQCDVVFVNSNYADAVKLSSRIHSVML